MQTTTEQDLVALKTQELCQAIVDQPAFHSLKQRVDLFGSDPAAQMQYQIVVLKGDALTRKQQMGTPLDNEEIADFEKHRETLVNNPIARDFLDAQQEMQKLQESVNQYVSKTFQLGRVPAAEDFDTGSCGPSCGCH